MAPQKKCFLKYYAVELKDNQRRLSSDKEQKMQSFAIALRVLSPSESHIA